MSMQARQGEFYVRVFSTTLVFDGRHRSKVVVIEICANGNRKPRLSFLGHRRGAVRFPRQPEIARVADTCLRISAQPLATISHNVSCR
jgi:hypothetical protein